MKIRFYSAASDDAAFLVPLVSESSGGVWPAVWISLAKESESIKESVLGI